MCFKEVIGLSVSAYELIRSEEISVSEANYEIIRKAFFKNYALIRVFNNIVSLNQIILVLNVSIQICGRIAFVQKLVTNVELHFT